jgi:O-antigen ligase
MAYTGNFCWSSYDIYPHRPGYLQKIKGGVLELANNSRVYIIAGISVCAVLLHLIASTMNITFLIGVPFLVPLAYTLIYYPKQLLLFLVFATPLSFNFENLKALGGIGFYFPTEPALFAIMLMYLLSIASGYRENGNFLKHPLTVAIIINLIWLFVTSLTSSMPVVSFKLLLSRLWFVLVIYFMMNHFFKDRGFIKKFFLALILGMTIAICYTLVRHSMYGFDEEAGHWVMWPFFKDHTSYGAILALLFPILVISFLRADAKSLQKLFLLVLTGIFTVGLVLSYTRAAWVSLVGAFGVYLLIRLRIDYKVVIAGILLLVGGYFGYEDQILHRLAKNRQDSSGNIAEHVQSITNISSDASNLERLNRWNSALRMFSDKPVLGHGPGTYMFQYATYQKSADKTIISTNQADGGNAHSEYLGPLSESGVLGMLTITAVFILSLVLGIRLYYQLAADKELRGIVLGIVLGLVTYYLHGILNNYLDTDKASVPIWGMMSILVAIDLYYPKNERLEKPDAK